MMVAAIIAGASFAFFVLAVVILLVSALRRPLDETDEWCSAVDIELSLAESRRRDRLSVTGSDHHG